MPKKTIILWLIVFLSASASFGQPACIPQGDQVTYGTNNQWIGYVYDNLNFTNYAGWVLAGDPSSPNFNTEFGGAYTNYPVADCSILTESFSVRYKLRKTFSAGTYEFIISGDDRIRLSIDGGATWLLDGWIFSGYAPLVTTVNLDGTYDMVLEFSEGTSYNTVYFSVDPACIATGTTAAYGTGNVWQGYLYSGIYFNNYKGRMQQGSGSSPAFSENFGGASVNYVTDACDVHTDFFSARYRLRHYFNTGSYSLTVSGDDKYRLSLDGGATWVIDRWLYDNGNTSRIYTANLSGTYDMVLEYYDKDGSNNLSFSYARNVVLPVNLLEFTSQETSAGNNVQWKIAESDRSGGFFELQSGTDGRHFERVATIPVIEMKQDYSSVDKSPAGGTTYYRLKITDGSGAVSFSRIIMQKTALEKISIYPTVVTEPRLTIKSASQLIKPKLTITDLSGKQIAVWHLNDLQQAGILSVSLSNCQSLRGLYLVQLSSENNATIVQKSLFP